MTLRGFIEKWRAVDLKERSASQSHFNDLCALLGEDDPITADPGGEWFTFEKGASKTTGGEGRSLGNSENTRPVSRRAQPG